MKVSDGSRQAAQAFSSKACRQPNARRLKAFNAPQHRYSRRMKRWALSIAACGLAAHFSSRGAAQESADQVPPQISREQWQAQIKAARERSEIIRRERRFFVPPPPTQEELAEEASRRVLEDDSLRSGDVVSTSRGLFRYQGASDRERKPDDFVRIR